MYSLTTTTCDACHESFYEKSFPITLKSRSVSLTQVKKKVKYGKKLIAPLIKKLIFNHMNAMLRKKDWS